MVLGGANEGATNDLTMVAGSNSFRIGVSPTPSGGYSFGSGWTREAMGYARVMPDSVLLPNGRVIILNGAQVRQKCMHDSNNNNNKRPLTPMGLNACMMYRPSAFFFSLLWNVVQCE